MLSEKKKVIKTRDLHVLLWALGLLVSPQHPEKLFLKKDKHITERLCCTSISRTESNCLELTAIESLKHKIL